jgi:hypothetical protein
MTCEEVCLCVEAFGCGGGGGGGVIFDPPKRFTAGHYYETGEDLALYVGCPMILVNNKIFTTKIPNDKRIIGFLGELTSGNDSIDNQLKTNIGYVVGVGDSFQWEKKTEIDPSGNYTSTEQKIINGINVNNEGGPIEVGDLLVSSSNPKFFKKQSDDLIRNYTAGRCMQDITFDTNGEATGIYCIMICG